VRELLGKLPAAYGGAEPGMSPRFKLVTDQAQAEADRLKDDFVSTEHLFIALADESGRSPSAQLLKQTGVTRDTILSALTSVRGSQRASATRLASYPARAIASTSRIPSTAWSLGTSARSSLPVKAREPKRLP